jgi:hypothetical protein
VAVRPTGNHERRVDYGFLGAQREPMSRANLDRTVALIAARSRAVIDDRVARPGFVSGIPACGAEPVDVAAHMNQLAWRLAHHSS